MKISGSGQLLGKLLDWDMSVDRLWLGLGLARHI